MGTLSWERIEIRGIPKEALKQPFKAMYILPNRDMAADLTAEKIIEQQTAKSDSVYTLPSSQQGNDVLNKVVTKAKERNVSFAQAKFFHMDEYFPIAAEDPNSFRNNLRNTFFEPLAIPPEHIHYINADPGSNGEIVAAKYEELLSATPVDLVLAPIGPGHIAFDEPGTSADSLTHVTTLSPKTVYRDHVERGLDTPDQAITQGIQTLLRANRIIFIDFSPGYNDYLKEALNGPISSDNTASFLRTVGNKVELITTQEIADNVGL